MFSVIYYINNNLISLISIACVSNKLNYGLVNLVLNNYKQVL